MFLELFNYLSKLIKTLAELTLNLYSSHKLSMANCYVLFLLNITLKLIQSIKPKKRTLLKHARCCTLYSILDYKHIQKLLTNI